MSAEIEKLMVEKLIATYAEAVNKGDQEAIAGFYSEDGVLIPQGFKPVHKSEYSGKYFTNKNVNISFSIKEVVIEGAFAFVEARATTMLVDLKSNQQLNKITRDLFILKSQEGNWKIYRYIFNSGNEA